MSEMDCVAVPVAKLDRGLGTQTLARESRTQHLRPALVVRHARGVAAGSASGRTAALIVLAPWAAMHTAGTKTFGP